MQLGVSVFRVDNTAQERVLFVDFFRFEHSLLILEPPEDEIKRNVAGVSTVLFVLEIFMRDFPVARLIGSLRVTRFT